MCVMSVVKDSAPPALSTLTEGFTVERSHINVSVKYAPSVTPLLCLTVALLYSNELRQLRNAATHRHLQWTLEIKQLSGNAKRIDANRMRGIH